MQQNLFVLGETSKQPLIGPIVAQFGHRKIIPNRSYVPKQVQDSCCLEARFVTSSSHMTLNLWFTILKRKEKLSTFT